MEDLKKEIYEAEEKYKRTIELLEGDDRVSERNKELFFEFTNSCLANGLSKHRIIIYLRHLRNIAIYSDVNFDKNMGKKDMEKVMSKIMNSDRYSEWSKETFKTTVKRYFGWLYELEHGDPLPDVVRWIRGTTPPNKLTKEDLITREEVQKMIDSTDKMMYKALISTLYEGVLRPGELLSMRINDVVFEERYLTINVSGKMEKKTGKRTVPFVNSYDLLRAWIDQHPFKKEKDHPLWIVTTQQKFIKDGKEVKDLYGKVISLRFLNKLIKDLAKKAGVKTYKNKQGSLTSKVYPYLFRHSGGTGMYKDYGEAIAKRLMGHSASSKMAAVYNHLNDSDVMDAVKKRHGLEEDEKEEDTTTCPRCKHPNSYGANLCSRCGMALSIGSAINVKIKEGETDKMKEFISILESNPQITQLLRDPGFIDRMVEEKANKMFEEWKNRAIIKP